MDNKLQQILTGKRSDLAATICSLYPTPISDTEAQEAASNLLGFMELLVEIDTQHKVAASKYEVQPCE